MVRDGVFVCVYFNCCWKDLHIALIVKYSAKDSPFLHSMPFKNYNYNFFLLSLARSFYFLFFPFLSFFLLRVFLSLSLSLTLIPVCHSAYCIELNKGSSTHIFYSILQNDTFFVWFHYSNLCVVSAIHGDGKWKEFKIFVPIHMVFLLFNQIQCSRFSLVHFLLSSLLLRL